MTPLNFAIPNWQLTIGDWDITHLISQFTLQRPRAEISTPYSWQGSFVLDESLNPDLVTESLDDLINPQRWATGMHPIRVRIDGKLIATVRIKRYFYNEDTYTGQAELTDQLGLRDFESPPKDFEGLGFQMSQQPIDVNSVVNQLLQLAGLFPIINIPGYFEVPPNKFTQSYISLAQQICGERGYWLYCDANELIRSVEYRQRSISFQRSRSQVKLFERQPGLEIPAELFRVTGSCEKIAICGSEDPIVNEEFETDFNGDKALRRRETVYPFKNGTRKIVVEEALASIFPNVYAGNSSIKTSEITIESIYFNSKGRLIKNEKKTSKLLGVALPDDFPGNLSMINNAQITKEEYSNSLPGASGGADDGILRSKITTNSVLFAVDKNTGTPYNSLVPIYLDGYELAVKERIVESWDSNSNFYGVSIGGNGSAKCRRFEYKRLIYKRNSLTVNVSITGGISGNTGFSYQALGELVLKSTERKTGQTPPEWPTKEPNTPIDSVIIKGESKLYSATSNPFYEKEFEISCSTLTSDAECQALANLIGKLQHQRYRSRLVTMPPDHEWLDNTTPFSTVNIHNGAFIMDSPVVVLDNQTMTFSFIGNYLGSIPVIGDIVPVIPDVPISPVQQIQSLECKYDYLVSVTQEIYFAAKTIEIFANYAYLMNPLEINNIFLYVTDISSNILIEPETKTQITNDLAYEINISVKSKTITITNNYTYDIYNYDIFAYQ
ncbi:hypothetical protein [Trichormus variabilis]|uniref:Uncharacterized protein n=1 Tax=Trichormus variabilis SAG 1403-4b TaxID=447716 RepID=A0A433UFB2_ANAVA|nr:hypothetical protein [Trichormus variabilis]MBD2628493.1 hypothetical protein [Trichormus variabilis FACHB-164]RUS92503.1 hypothetical protein DSM107003_49860 [Trichormus variabilis SAG 1403-4b]